jgi:hypothetical protein
MNDAHDNAADDRAMYRRIQTDLAIEAFRKQETKRIQLEMAEHALTKLLNGRVDMDRYVEETEQIRHQMELKRADMARLGKLPREEHAPVCSGHEPEEWVRSVIVKREPALDDTPNLSGAIPTTFTETTAEPDPGWPPMSSEDM